MLPPALIHRLSAMDDCGGPRLVHTESSTLWTNHTNKNNLNRQTVCQQIPQQPWRAFGWNFLPVRLVTTSVVIS